MNMSPIKNDSNEELLLVRCYASNWAEFGTSLMKIYLLKMRLLADALSQEKERAEGLMKEYGGDIHYLPFGNLFHM